MAAAMISGARTKKKRALFVVPRKELIRQMAETFRQFGINYSYIAAGQPFNPHAYTHICSTMTLVKRLTFVNPDVVFIDETHYGSTALDKIINHYRSQGAWIVGLSATPVKLDGRGLDCWYDEMVKGMPIRWLIDNNWLSDYRGFAPSHVDLTGIKTVAGDYAKGQLNERMEGDRVLVGNAVSHYKKHADGKLNIAYCVSIKHSEMVAEEFRLQGVPAMSISGKTPDDERKRIIRAFAKRELKVLCNCDLLTFGFDLASSAGMDVTVESMSDLRPTKSLALQCQKWGRVLRKKDTPALIFDHANNFETHGMPCEERAWTLAAKETRGGKGQSEKTFEVRECPKCYRCHKPSPTCPSCGFVYPIEERKIEEVEGELEEIKAKQARKKRGLEESKCRTLEDWQRLARERGYNQGWAWHRYNARRGKA
jgi:superfamily II DNA or RNA helicase